jgi:hypothetical protein
LVKCRAPKPPENGVVTVLPVSDSASKGDAAIAKAHKEERAPTFETDIEKRNRALIAFIMMTGARVDAAADTLETRQS